MGNPYATSSACKAFLDEISPNLVERTSVKVHARERRAFRYKRAAPGCLVRLSQARSKKYVLIALAWRREKLRPVKYQKSNPTGEPSQRLYRPSLLPLDKRLLLDCLIIRSKFEALKGPVAWPSLNKAAVANTSAASMHSARDISCPAGPRGAHVAHVHPLAGRAITQCRIFFTVSQANPRYW